MAKERYHSGYGVQVHRKQTIHTFFLLIFTGILLSILAVLFLGWRNRLGGETKELLALWEKGSYAEACRLSGEKLEQKPMDYFLLTLHGFSSYELARAQIDTLNTLTFIDDSIWSLRKALLTKKGERDPRIYYVLGKDYYYKGAAYADLAIKFLEAARDMLYRARDIPEYLGLAYAAIHDYRNSVAAFALALNPDGEEAAEGSDLLLLRIARSYMALEERETARSYLLRCISVSRDADRVLEARLFLGNLLAAEGKLGEAETLYLSILDEDDENAEAHFQLGEVYAARGEPGDATMARARWRRAYQIDRAHSQAGARLNQL